MRFTRKGVATLVVTALIFVLTACASNPQLPKPAAEVMRDALNKLSALTSHTFDIDIQSDLNGPPGEPPAKLVFKMGLDGGVEAKDPQNVSFSLKLDGSGNADKDSAAANLDLRFKDNMLYFMVGKFDLSGSQEIPKETVAQFIGKWFKLALPAGFMGNLAQTFAKVDPATLTPEQKKIKDLYEHTDFFTSPQLVGSEDVKGESSYHFKTMLDEKAVLAFFKQVSETSGGGFPPEQLQNAQEFFSKIENTSTDLWVGSSSGVINKINAVFQVKGTEKDPSGTFTFQATLGDFDKPITVEVPAGAVEFPFNPFSPLDSAGMMGEPPYPTPAEDALDLKVTQ